MSLSQSPEVPMCLELAYCCHQRLVMEGGGGAGSGKAQFWTMICHFLIL